MDWKDFFKPDWNKIVLFVILFLILPTPSYVIYPCTLEFGSYCPPPGWTIIPFTGFGILIDTLEGQFNSNYSTPFLFSLITSYLLSCLIVFAYNKYRGKKL